MAAMCELRMRFAAVQQLVRADIDTMEVEKQAAKQYTKGVAKQRMNQISSSLSGSALADRLWVVKLEQT